MVGISMELRPRIFGPLLRRSAFLRFSRSFEFFLCLLTLLPSHCDVFDICVKYFVSFLAFRALFLRGNDNKTFSYGSLHGISPLMPMPLFAANAAMQSKVFAIETSV